MVKIPGLDDLKKMSSDLIDSAKTVKIGGMVDRIKGGMESVGIRKGAGSVVVEGDDPLATLLQEANATSAELTQLVKKLQAQLAGINQVAATYQKPTPPAVLAETGIKQEDDKKL